MVNSIEEAFAEEQTQAREMLVAVPHQLQQNFKMVASPIKMSETPIEYRRAPPQLGEHTEQILKGICTETELKALQQSGVVGA